MDSRALPFPCCDRSIPTRAPIAFRWEIYLPWLGVLFMLLLASRMSRSEGIVILITMAIAIANWLWARNRRLAAA